MGKAGLIDEVNEGWSNEEREGAQDKVSRILALNYERLNVKNSINPYK